MQKNVAGQKFRVFAFNATTNLPVAGDAANITAYISKDYGTVTALADGIAVALASLGAPLGIGAGGASIGEIPGEPGGPEKTPLLPESSDAKLGTGTTDAPPNISPAAFAIRSASDV